MASEEEVQRRLAELSARLDALTLQVEALRSERVSSSNNLPFSETIADKRSTSQPLSPTLQIPYKERKPAGAKLHALEGLIGSQFLNRVGIFAVLIAMAWFLKLAVDRNWIGPGVRVVIGLVISVAIFAWSERFRSKGFIAFSNTLKALGAGIAYLSLWAASSVFHLVPVAIVFAAMTAETLIIAWLAWRQNSELLAVYALAGGLATPALLSLGGKQELTLFSYLLILDAGALLLFALRPWARLIFAAFLGTVGYAAVWAILYYEPSAFSTTVVFAILFYLLFATPPLLVARREARVEARHPQRLFQIAFPIANAGVVFVALMLLCADPAHYAMRPWLAFGLSGVCFLLAAPRSLLFSGSFSNVHLGLAIFFFTVAIPLEFDGCAVTLWWLCLAQGLLALAAARSSIALRIFGAAVLLLVALDVMLLEWLAPAAAPSAVFANSHFATYLAAAGVFAAIVWLSFRVLQRVGAGSERVEPPAAVLASWVHLEGFSCVMFSLIVLLAVTVEIHHYWFCGSGLFRDFCGAGTALARRTVYASFTLSAWYMIYGAALMATGFWRRIAFLRWQALVLLGLSIAKVFLMDMSHLSQGYRVLSFLVLGILLLVVSFAYQKDWF